MRYLIFLVFIFEATESRAQNGLLADKAFINSYCDTARTRALNNIYSKQITRSNYTYLAKVRTDDVALFRKKIKPLIRRQLSANWFIVKAKETVIKNDIFIE